MSSFTRRIQKKWAKALEGYEALPQQYRLHEDGSYNVLHPTKGWRHVCAARARMYGT